ncbi:hypothetical protein [Nonlabens xiamenensis]|nr:hypothetical protein [Nonlabens xiamenensis]
MIKKAAKNNTHTCVSTGNPGGPGGPIFPVGSGGATCWMSARQDRGI